jgi:hypothetical protein
VHDGWVGGKAALANHRHLCTITIPPVDMGAQENAFSTSDRRLSREHSAQILLRIFLAFLTCNVLFGDLARSRRPSPPN